MSACSSHLPLLVIWINLAGIHKNLSMHQPTLKKDKKFLNVCVSLFGIRIALLLYFIFIYSQQMYNKKSILTFSHNNFYLLRVSRYPNLKPSGQYLAGLVTEQRAFGCFTAGK